MIGAQAMVSQKPRPLTAGRIKYIARQAELADGRGATGFTLLKHAAKPIQRLIDARKIGPEELQAAQDITTAFLSMAGALMLRAHRMERMDPSYDSHEPAAVVDAQRRYRIWADHWSMMRKRHADRTLEVVIATVIDERLFDGVDSDLGMRHGTAKLATIRGLRDYAARANWAGSLTAQWKADAGLTFSRRVPDERR